MHIFANVEKKEMSYRFERVMLIDDDATDNYINQRIITESGFSKNVLTMTDAETGLSFLLQNSDIPDNLPQFIFLDLNLPGLNGFDFLTEFSKLDDLVQEKCKIIVLTNTINADIIKRLSANPFVQMYLEKPLSVESLKNVK